MPARKTGDGARRASASPTNSQQLLAKAQREHCKREWGPQQIMLWLEEQAPARVQAVRGLTMGEMKHGLYTGRASREGALVRFQLIDPSARIVAEGTGPTVSAAEQDALERTTDDGARAYLLQVKFHEGLAD